MNTGFWQDDCPREDEGTAAMAPASYAPALANFPLLLISADDGDLRALHRILCKECTLHHAATCVDGRTSLRRVAPWVVVCDEVLADGDWRDVLGDLQSGQQGPPLVVISRLADERLWAEVLNLGAYDLLTKPFVAVEVTRVVRMAARHGSRSGRGTSGGLPWE